MRNYLDFSNKVVLVTGSTRNLGKAIAELFAEHGATVVINSRTESDVAESVRRLHDRGFRALGVHADVGNEEEVLMLVERIVETAGRLDIVVNNAAFRPFEAADAAVNEASFRNALQTNTIGVFNVARIAAEAMKKQRGGSIISISSPAALEGSDVAGLDYIVSKGAILSLTRGLARQFGEFGIRVNAVIPRFVQQEGARNASELLEAAVKHSFLKRFASPRELASVCLFLASDMASYVTGEVIALGGFPKPTVEL